MHWLEITGRIQLLTGINDIQQLVRGQFLPTVETKSIPEQATTVFPFPLSDILIGRQAITDQHQNMMFGIKELCQNLRFSAQKIHDYG